MLFRTGRGLTTQGRKVEGQKGGQQKWARATANVGNQASSHSKKRGRYEGKCPNGKEIKKGSDEDISTVPNPPESNPAVNVGKTNGEKA